MNQRPIAPSPVARTLLDVAERMADGTIEIGGRRIDIRRGAAVGVSAENGDMDLTEFLVKSSRLTKSEASRARAAAAKGQPIMSLLAAHVAPQVLRRSVERIWVERLARGIAEEEDRGADPPSFVVAQPAWESDVEVALLPLVLEALSRRAAAGDADEIGVCAGQLFEWDDSVHRDAAETWLALDRWPSPAVVSLILSSAPAGAPKLAALLRAGLAHLRPRGSQMPAPPRRPRSFPAPSKSVPPPSRVSTRPPPPPEALEPEVAAAVASTTLTSAPPARTLSTLPPPRDADISLSPGHAQPTHVTGSLPPPTADTDPLNDPLDDVERLIANLEQTRAPGPERAAAWRE
ncbi:MAG: hypothetical protein KC417_10465, partial [Myxococcales bacterium]|nr:hypothetical protein [Myxococcales bacterium]